MPVVTEVGLSRGNFVLAGDQPPSQKGGEARGQSPPIFGQCQLWPNGWMKMALGMEVGVGPVYVVLEGDTAALPQKGAESPNFRPIFIVAKRWMHQHAT